MVLMVDCWHYGMPFDTNGCVSMQVNFNWIKWMYFSVNEFEVGVNDSIFSGNEQQNVYMSQFNENNFNLLGTTNPPQTYRASRDEYLHILFEMLILNSL